MNFFQQQDKQLHIGTQFATELFLTTLIYFAFGYFGFIGFIAAVVSTLIAAHITLHIGIGKEVFDFYHPATHTADIWDIVADAIGVDLAVITTLIFVYFKLL
jgi:hypothetical protein